MLTDVTALGGYIEGELNVMKVSCSADETAFGVQVASSICIGSDVDTMQLVATPNFEVLGRRLKVNGNVLGHQLTHQRASSRRWTKPSVP